MQYEEFVELFNSGNVSKLTDDEINNFFIESCSSGYLDIAKWLWDISEGKINIHAYNDTAFQWSCVKGYLDIAKWLWDISGNKIDIHASNDGVFRWSCEDGHLEITKWLWIISNYKFNICSKYPIQHIIKYRYQSTYLNDNLHIMHHYYKPIDGPGYLHAINF